MKSPSSVVRTCFICIGLLLSVAMAYLPAQGISETQAKTPTMDMEDAIVYTDSIGTVITLTSVPKKIVSLGPNVTETLFALGAGDLLVGRTDYCDYPEQVSRIESIGTLWQPSIEKILDLEPDLIIASSLANDEVLQALKKTGIPLATINKQEKLSGAMEMIQDIGILCGREEESKSLTADMRRRIDAVQERVKDLPKPTCYYVIDFGQFDSTATGDTYINEMIELAGGDNIAKDGSYWTYSKELLAEKDPQIIILTPHWGSDYETTKQLFCSSSIYKDLTAVKTRNIYPIDNNTVDRQGPRSAQAIEDFAKIFHPQAMAD